MDCTATFVFLVTDEMMQDMAKRVEMNTKEYTSQCFNALTANLSGNDTFIYEANPNGSNLEVWHLFHQ
jgi:hypothetical protein